MFTPSAIRERTLPDVTSVSPWCDCKVKRTFDVVTASVLIMVCCPLMLMSAILVRLTSPGPILFRHKRLGKHGTEFSVLKFRTMFVQQIAVGPEVTRSGDCRVT